MGGAADTTTEESNAGDATVLDAATVTGTEADTWQHAGSCPFEGAGIGASSPTQQAWLGASD